LLTSLQASYARDGSGLSITVAAGQAQMASSPHVFAYVKAALGLDPPHTLSQAAMETLAIVAYRQPVTRSEIEQIRGVRSSSSLDLLIAKGLVEEYGKLDLPGKPSTFVTSREFLKMMKVAALNDLPEFEDFRSDLSLSD
jgi:segregation and condensation protein B